MVAEFVLEVIPEADITPDTDAAIRALLCVCFPQDEPAFSQSRSWHASDPSFSVVGRLHQRIVAHVGIVVRTIRVGQREVAVAGVQNLCVSPTHRGRGLAQAAMAHALDHARRRGLRFGLLFCVPELVPYYESAGWSRSDATITMLDETGQDSPLPEPNIGMHIAFGDESFPRGDIHLAGRDW
jgi:predicted N-acetyltransferase YhbS